MARKTKDELTKKAIATEETTSSNVKKTSKTSKKVALKNDSKDTSAKKTTTRIPKAEKKVSTKEPKTIKKSTSKSVKVDSIIDSKIDEKKSSIKKEKTQKVATKKTTAKKDTVKNATVKKATTKNDTKNSEKKVADKKNDTKKAAPKKSSAKKPVAKTTSTKSSTTKKASTAKTSEKKAVTKKVSTKKPTTKKSSTKKSSVKKSSKEVVSKDSKAKILPINPIEYYDLPYRYNQTVVKVLAQNPNTLFVYWDISDTDRENFETKYGKMFFYNTKPVLVVHNLTTNYTFEIDIDDFANNWYIHVDNTKCKYVVELGRRPKYQGVQDIPVNYLNVAFSNIIEIPNDHILFFKENDKIYFKNIKTNKITEKIIKKKPHLNIVKDIYKNYNLSEDENRFDFNNPSSQNPTSTFL